MHEWCVGMMTRIPGARFVSADGLAQHSAFNFTTSLPQRLAQTPTRAAHTVEPQCLLLAPSLSSGGASAPAARMASQLVVRSWNIGVATGAFPKLLASDDPIPGLTAVADGADVLLLQEIGAWHNPPPQDRCSSSSRRRSSRQQRWRVAAAVVVVAKRGGGCSSSHNSEAEVVVVAVVAVVAVVVILVLVVVLIVVVVV